MPTLLFIADISGRPGRKAVAKLVEPLRERYDIDLVVANSENAAAGLGLTKPTAAELFDAGVDVITLGNHAFAKRDVYTLMDTEARILRPANYPPGAPGHGWGIFETPKGEPVGVINLMGRVFMNPLDCPFRTANAVLEEMEDDTATILVDMHAEATSEKMALAWYLDGRVSAVIGTHTHIQTSDERVLPGGTAYLTDAGMTGVHESVLGLDKDTVIERFIKQIPGKFLLAEGEATLQGAVVRTEPATSIERISFRESDL